MNKSNKSTSSWDSWFSYCWNRAYWWIAPWCFHVLFFLIVVMFNCLFVAQWKWGLSVLFMHTTEDCSVLCCLQIIFFLTLLFARLPAFGLMSNACASILYSLLLYSSNNDNKWICCLEACIYTLPGWILYNYYNIPCANDAFV
jgi:hypothetical protein